MLEQTGAELGNRSTGKWGATVLVVCALLVWAGIHFAFHRSFLHHDSWKHIFPFTYRVMQQADGFALPMWLGGVDSGSPLLIYTLSMSILNPVRLVTIAAGSWLQWDVGHSLYLHKVSILLAYLIFCGGMVALGRLLFKHRLSALYLFIATLFAGLGLETLHSDQNVSILFWIPWATAAAVLFHRHRDSARGAHYLCLAVLLVCLEALDQHPSLVILPAALAVVTYVALWPRETVQFLRRHGWRLWPALIPMAITAVDLHLFAQAMTDYRPSLRQALRVDPREMGETGFVQPPSFPAAVLPLAYLSAHEQLSQNIHAIFGRCFFVPRINSLVFNLGFIPLVLAGAFLLRPGASKLRRGLAFWVAAVLLVSLQWTHLYFALADLPGFDSFRSYFLLLPYVVLGLLLMSGYGLDALLTLDPNQRRSLLRRALLMQAVLVVLGLAGVCWLLKKEVSGAVLRATLGAGTIDLVIAVVCSLALLRSLRSADALGQVRWVVAALVLAQGTYFVGVYRALGVDRNELLCRYGINRHEEARLNPQGSFAPNQFRRTESSLFAWSYLSRRETTSLRRDLEGTFLRSKDDALYQEGLDPAVLLALSGVSHPVFWLSAAAEPYGQVQQVVAELNGHRDVIGAYLARVVHVSHEGLGRLYQQRPRGSAASALSRQDLGDRAGERGAISEVRVERDRFRLCYRADRPAFLTGAVTYDRNWVARLNGRPVPVVRGNFNGLTVPVAAGEGTVELRYESRSSMLYFASRYVLLFVGLAGICTLLRRPAALRSRSEPAPARVVSAAA